MRAPLPRVWDAVEGGLAEPTRATISHGHQHTVGGDVSIAGLEEARRLAELLSLLLLHGCRPVPSTSVDQPCRTLTWLMGLTRSTNWMHCCTCSKMHL
jgi:hypothetical protein